MENIHAVIVYDCVDVLHSALTLFNVVAVEYLVKGVVFLGNGYRIGMRKIDLFLL